MHSIMKLKFHYNTIIALIIAGFALSNTSCDRDNNSPGYTYFPDMTYSTAYESFSENPNFENNTTLREPVEGTVPRGYFPLPYTKDLEDREKAGRELTNPFEFDTETKFDLIPIETKLKVNYNNSSRYIKMEG